METYKIEIQNNIMNIKFGAPAPNTDICRELAAYLATNPPKGGGLLLINGPASLPVAFVLSHAVAHLYSTIGVFDPKLNGYVVAVSHSPDHKVGDLITA